MSAGISWFTFVEDLQSDKSPLQYSLTRILVCFDPTKIVSEPQQCEQDFKKLLRIMESANLVNVGDCDEAISEFSDFLEMVASKEEFISFKVGHDSVTVCNYERFS